MYWALYLLCGKVVIVDVVIHWAGDRRAGSGSMSRLTRVGAHIILCKWQCRRSWRKTDLRGYLESLYTESLSADWGKKGHHLH